MRFLPEGRGCLALSVGVALGVLILFLPYFFYPKRMKAVSSPDGIRVAEVWVRPMRGFPVAGYITLLGSSNVEVTARVRRHDSGAIQCDRVLTPSEDMESDAERVSIEWKSDGSVQFTSRDGAIVQFQP